jgi:HEAT repeat protein
VGSQAGYDKVIHALLADLTCKDEQRRLRAVIALHRLGRKAATALPALVRAFAEDSSADVRAGAGETLRALGSDSLPYLIPLLGRSNPRTRRATVRLVGEIGSPKPAALLVRLAADPDPDLRADVMEALGLIGDPSTLPVVLRAMKEDRSLEVRRSAVWALGHFRPTPPIAIKSLVALVAAPAGGVEADELAPRAAAALAEIGRPAVPHLIPLLGVSGNSTIVRRRVLSALRWMQSEAEAAVPALTRVLTDDPDLDVRRRAADVLARVGPRARAAIPGITRALRDENPVLRVSAASALLAIEPNNPSGLQILTSALKAKDAEARTLAFFELGALGPRASLAVPSLLSALGDREPTVRAMAAYALGAVGGASPDVLSALTRASKDDDETVRGAARDALQRLRRR